MGDDIMRETERRVIEEARGHAAKAEGLLALLLTALYADSSLRAPLLKLTENELQLALGRVRQDQRAIEEADTRAASQHAPISKPDVREHVLKGLERATARTIDPEILGRDLAERLWARIDSPSARAVKVTIDLVVSASNHPGEALRVLIAEALGHPIGQPIEDEELRANPVTRASVIRWNELVRAGGA